MASVLAAPHLHNEEAAYEFVAARIWSERPHCPRYGCTAETIGALKGKSTQIGARKCCGCRKPFTVEVGTIFEASHVPLHIWLQAIHLICSSKKGISTNQHADLGRGDEDRLVPRTPHPQGHAGKPRYLRPAAGRHRRGGPG